MSTLFCLEENICCGYLLGAPREVILMSTHNMFSSRKKKTIYRIIWILFLARAMKPLSQDK